MTESIITRCKGCGTRNKVPLNRIKDHPVCGKCKAVLTDITLYTEPVVVTDATFEKEVLSHPGSVILDCWAPWCGHCAGLSTTLTQAAKDYSGRIKIAKLNVDQNPVIAGRFNIMSLPMMLFFKNGKVMGSAAGALPRQEIDRYIYQYQMV